MQWENARVAFSDEGFVLDSYWIRPVDQVRTLPSRDTHAKSLRTGSSERVEHIPHPLLIQKQSLRERYFIPRIARIAFLGVFSDSCTPHQITNFRDLAGPVKSSQKIPPATRLGGVIKCKYRVC